MCVGIVVVDVDFGANSNEPMLSTYKICIVPLKSATARCVLMVDDTSNVQHLNDVSLVICCTHLSPFSNNSKIFNIPVASSFAPIATNLAVSGIHRVSNMVKSSWCLMWLNKIGSIIACQWLRSAKLYRFLIISNAMNSIKCTATLNIT